MRSFVFVTALAAAACSSSSTKPATTAQAHEASIPSVTVEELDAKLAAGSSQAVDANLDETRKKLGVVPGAVLLSDSQNFQLAELPADKSKELVFYCANQQCGASHQAAAKAITAGYSNVRVMPDGIAGWVKAGKKTQSM
jgi:rhodanese-related sulfurtransferase